MLEILVGMFGAESHVSVGGEMEHEIAAGHRLRQRGQIEIVAFDEFEAGVLERAFDERALASREIIPADDAPALREQAIHEAAADKAGCAGDEHILHRGNTQPGAELRGVGRGTRLNPMTRLLKTKGRKGSGKKLRASIEK